MYLSIRSGESVYGVIGIPVKKDAMDSFEYSILLSVINECALAMENSQNAIEKKKCYSGEKRTAAGRPFASNFS